MSEQQPQQQPEQPEKQNKSVDSFGNKVEKSPWLIYALLQIPLVIIMVVIIYVMWRNAQS